MKSKQLEGAIVFKKYKIGQKIGTGAFGEIYRAQSQLQNGDVVAIKTEPVTTKHPQLMFESKLYKYLQSEEPAPGIPKIYAAGVENGFNMMIMELLGKSLEDIFVDREKRFSIKTVLLVGLQALDRIQFLHDKGFLHRDIKPDNFMMGTGQNSHIVYLIDMGLGKKYICKEKVHIPYKQGKDLTGTARYASINTHKGFEQSRRDDIQSLGYNLMYLLRGILPWQNMKASTTKQKYEMIKNKKILTSLAELCGEFPVEFSTFISYGRNLKFDEKPDYSYLKGVLKNVASKQKITLDNKYDWIK